MNTGNFLGSFRLNSMSGMCGINLLPLQGYLFILSSRRAAPFVGVLHPFGAKAPHQLLKYSKQPGVLAPQGRNKTNSG